MWGSRGAMWEICNCVWFPKFLVNWAHMLLSEVGAGDTNTKGMWEMLVLTMRGKANIELCSKTFWDLSAIVAVPILYLSENFVASSLKFRRLWFFGYRPPPKWEFCIKMINFSNLRGICSRFPKVLSLTPLPTSPISAAHPLERMFPTRTPLCSGFYSPGLRARRENYTLRLVSKISWQLAASAALWG